MLFFSGFYLFSVLSLTVLLSDSMAVDILLIWCDLIGPLILFRNCVIMMFFFGMFECFLTLFEELQKGSSKCLLDWELHKRFTKWKIMLKAWRESYKSEMKIVSFFPERRISLSLFVLSVKSHCILLTFFFLLNSKSGLTGSVLHGIRSQRIKLQWDVSDNIPSCAP